MRRLLKGVAVAAMLSAAPGAMPLPAPATSIESVHARHEGSRTTVTLRADGQLTPAHVEETALPPRRLVLDWQISHEWGFDPNLHTDVEVIFTAVGERETRIDFEHRGLEAFGDSEAAVKTRSNMDSGWGHILESFKAAVGG